MQMRTLKKFRYARKTYAAGDLVDILPQDVRAALALGWVEYISEPSVKSAAPTYSRRDMTAAKPTAAVAAQGPELLSLRGEYQTRFGKRPYMGWDAATLRTKMFAQESPQTESDVPSDETSGE